MNKIFKATILTLTLMMNNVVASELIDDLKEQILINTSKIISVNDVKFNNCDSLSDKEIKDIQENTVDIYNSIINVINYEEEKFLCEAFLKLISEDKNETKLTELTDDEKRVNQIKGACEEKIKQLQENFDNLLKKKFDLINIKIKEEPIITLIFTDFIIIPLYGDILGSRFADTKILDKLFENKIQLDIKTINEMLDCVVTFCNKDYYKIDKNYNTKIAEYLKKFMENTVDLALPDIFNSKFFCQAIESGFPLLIDELKDIMLKKYVNLIFDKTSNHDIDGYHMLACFQSANYLQIAMNNLIKNELNEALEKKLEEDVNEELEEEIKEDVKKKVKEELSQKAFLVAYPEYNPVNIALEAKNYNMAYYFIQDPDSLLNADVWKFEDSNNIEEFKDNADDLKDQFSELIKLSRIHNKSNEVENEIRKSIKNATNIDATDEEIQKEIQKEILSFDMAAVNFKNLFAKSIEDEEFDISYALLKEFSNDIDKYKNLSGTIGNALREIYIDVLMDVMNKYSEGNNLDEDLQTKINAKIKILEQEINPLSNKLKHTEELLGSLSNIISSSYDKMEELQNESSNDSAIKKSNIETQIKYLEHQEELAYRSYLKVQQKIALNYKKLKKAECDLNVIKALLETDIKNKSHFIIEALDFILDNNLTDYNRHLSKEEVQIISKSDEKYTVPSNISSAGNFYNTNIIRLLKSINEKLFGVN